MYGLSLFGALQGDCIEKSEIFVLNVIQVFASRFEWSESIIWFFHVGSLEKVEKCLRIFRGLIYSSQDQKNIYNILFLTETFAHCTFRFVYQWEIDLRGVSKQNRDCVLFEFV